MYTPVSILNATVQLGPALVYFLHNAEINLYSEGVPINLLDLFPMAKNGYALRDLFAELFYLYAYVNSPISTSMYKSDNLIMESMGGNIPSLYYQHVGNNNRENILMNEAINAGLIDRPMNTFEVIELTHPQFNRSLFESYFSLNMSAVNSIPLKEIPGSELFSSDPEFTKTLLKENALMRDISELLRRFQLKLMMESRLGLRMDVYDFIKYVMENHKRQVAEFLITHPRINKLYISILFGDIENIIYYLPKIDPRADNHKAYFLAVENGDNNILALVKESIIQWNLTYNAGLRRVFSQSPEADGLFNTGRDLYEYTRKF